MSTVVSADAASTPSFDPTPRSHPQPWAPQDITPRVELAGCLVDLMDEDTAISTVLARAQRHYGPPLSVVSANLDHLHHFGRGARDRDALEQARARGDVEMLTLLDGKPLMTRTVQLTGTDWPRLSGSDLIAPILEAAAARGVSVGFLGGSEESHFLLRQALAVRWPELDLRGCWAPSRETLADADASRQVAADIAAAGVDILVVCLGKPRQELWIAEHGVATGAGALLAFGAVVDFLAGRVSRAPSWVSDAGLEWAYRLIQEPRRLFRRYLVQGPPAYRALRNDSMVARPGPDRGLSVPAPTVARLPESRPTLSIVHDAPDVTATILTRPGSRTGTPSAAGVLDLVDDLRRDAAHRSIAVVVVDTDSTGATDDTVSLLAAERDVTVVRAPADTGRSGGLELALAQLHPASAVLLLDPDLRLARGAVDAMRARLDEPGVGVVAARLVDLTRSDAGETIDSITGDQPGWETESSRIAHAVEWADGACLLVRPEVLAEFGSPDARTGGARDRVDFLRRVRRAGWTVWFEPTATALRAGTSTASTSASTVEVGADARGVSGRVRYVDN